MEFIGRAPARLDDEKPCLSGEILSIFHVIPAFFSSMMRKKIKFIITVAMFSKTGRRGGRV